MFTRIPFYGVNRYYKQFQLEILQSIDEALAEEPVFRGRSVTLLEDLLKQRCCRKHAVAVGSCTDGLTFALSALRIGPGSEVLVPAFTFCASILPVLRVGATPIFVDVDPSTFHMDVAQAQRLVSDRTRALLVVDLFGQALPASAFADFASRHQLLLIEDAAQAFGASQDGVPAGALGDISCLSFDPTKVIGAFGSGGLVLTDRADLADHARQLGNYGRNSQTLNFERPGCCSRLSSQLAAQVLFALRHFPARQRQRERIADCYLSQLNGVGDIQLPTVLPGCVVNWHKFVIQTGRRDALRLWLDQHGIETVVHYPCATCDEPVIRGLGLPAWAVHCPIARRVAASVLSLPLYPELQESEVACIIKTTRRFFDHRRSCES